MADHSWDEGLAFCGPRYLKIARKPEQPRILKFFGKKCAIFIMCQPGRLDLKIYLIKNENIWPMLLKIKCIPLFEEKQIFRGGRNARWIHDLRHAPHNEKHLFSDFLNNTQCPIRSINTNYSLQTIDDKNRRHRHEKYAGVPIINKIQWGTSNPWSRGSNPPRFLAEGSYILNWLSRESCNWSSLPYFMKYNATAREGAAMHHMLEKFARNERSPIKTHLAQEEIQNWISTCQIPWTSFWGIRR